MNDMLEKLPILEAKLILKKKELESKKKVKEENNNKVIQEQYNPNKVMELEYELKNLENDKILAQNKNKKLKSIKIKTIIFSLFNLLGSFFTSICGYGIGAGMSNAKKVLEDVKNNESKYDYIEIMNCVGGCIGGGGQPKINIHLEDKIKEKRIENLYNKDKNVNIRFSHENPEIKDIYKNFLIEPMSELSEELLHTSYKNRTNY